MCGYLDILKPLFTDFISAAKLTIIWDLVFLSDLQDSDQVVKEVREGSERLTVKSVSVITIERRMVSGGEDGGRER